MDGNKFGGRAIRSDFADLQLVLGSYVLPDSLRSDAGALDRGRAGAGEQSHPHQVDSALLSVSVMRALAANVVAASGRAMLRSAGGSTRELFVGSFKIYRGKRTCHHCDETRMERVRALLFETTRFYGNAD